MKDHRLCVFRNLVLFVMVVGGSVVAGTFHMVRSTTSGGGVMQSGDGRFELQGSLGQPVAGRAIGGDFTLDGGFWFQILPGDCDVDGVVGLSDYQPFASCLTGPDTGIGSSGCACFDLDASGTVDLRDASRFQIAFQGGS